MEDFSEELDTRQDMAAGLDTLLGRMVMGGIVTPAVEKSAFYCSQTPPITPKLYAQRMADYLHCSPEAFVAGSLYVWRLHQLAPELFCHSTQHKIMLAAAVCGAKWCDDKFFTNAYYAEVGGVPQRTLNKIERELAAQLRFGFFVTKDQFGKMRSHLRACTYAAAQETTPLPLLAAGVSPEQEHLDKKLRTTGTWGDSTSDPLLPAVTSARQPPVSFATELAPANVDDFLVRDRYSEPDDVMRSIATAKPARSASQPYTLKRSGSWFDVLPSLTDANESALSDVNAPSSSSLAAAAAVANPPAGEPTDHSPPPALGRRRSVTAAPTAACFAPALCCADRPECNMMTVLCL